MDEKRKLLEARGVMTDCFERIGTDLNKLESTKAFLNTSDNQKNATDNHFMK